MKDYKKNLVAFDGMWVYSIGNLQENGKDDAK